MDLGLTGKRAVITGATRGIGLSIARCLAAEGCHVSICGRSESSMHAALDTLKQYGVSVIGQLLDIGCKEDVKQWIQNTKVEFGGIDIFISNVSAQSFDWEESYNIDIRSCVDTINTILPHLEESKSAAIVAIASQAAMMSVPSYKPYSAMKAALISYMSSLSRELAPKGIRVNTVSPSEIYFKGGFWERMQTESPELYSKAQQRNIMGRLGTDVEVAKAVTFLASSAASFISGANLMVDGASREYVQF